MCTGGGYGDVFRVNSVDVSQLADKGIVTEGDGSDKTREYVACGEIVDGHELRIVDPETKDVLADGCVGEIWSKVKALLRATGVKKN